MTALTVSRQRVRSIDTLRGLVMIIMALDHVRDFFHLDAPLHDPLDFQTTTPVLFLTRWVTHFCAPVFLFLSGTSACLMGARRTRKDLSIFLLKRGLWLAMIEITIVTFGWTFDPLYHVIILQVIWAIGISMIILSVLVYLPMQAIFVIGFILVFGHNLLDYPGATPNRNFGLWWDLIHHARFAAYPLSKNHIVIIAYAFLPWTGIMCLGFAAGQWFYSNVDPLIRQRKLVVAGLSLTVVFIALRFINHYGNPFPWEEQKTKVFSLLSFINANKYPPSLMYFCMTVGPALVLLAFFENVQNRLTGVVNIYGRVPFFYYILHLYLIHLMAVVAAFITGVNLNASVPPNAGFQLWVVYVVWIAVVIILYPLCRWYNGFKSRHNYWWLSYL